MTTQERDHAYVLPTYARFNISFTSGKGSTIVDEEGKEYIDFTSGIGVTSVGHGNVRLAKAIADQASQLIHTSNLFYIEPQAKLAERLNELSGYDMQCFFANSGAEANEGAIKIARKYDEANGNAKRYQVITLKHSFHGRTISTLKATGQESMHNYFGPFPDGFIYADTIDAIEGMITNVTVAVMIELVQGEGGVEALDMDKVQALATLLKEKNILLIIDEVQTGVYRTGEFLASNYYEIEPDIVTLAKGLGGGVPVGVVMTKHKNVLQAGDHGSTFGGNFLATAAANTVLNILEEEKKQSNLDLIIAYFEAEFRQLVTRFPDVIEKSVGFGLMRGLRIKDADTFATIIKQSQEEGLLLLKAGRNTLRFLPALTTTEKEMDEGFKRLNRVLKGL
jgi:acetylornithine aminotransferase